MKIYHTERLLTRCENCPDCHNSGYAKSESRCGHHLIVNEMVGAIIKLKDGENFPTWCPLPEAEEKP